MDLAAHCINDVLTTGADPLFFLDYVAANTIDVEQVLELVEGAADVCRAAGCAILGGETAELPGIYREQEIDFCGTVVGVVDRTRLIDGSRVEAGDVVLGLPSAGIHANGFSLVRRIVGEGDVRRRPAAAADASATSTTSGRCAPAPTSARSRTSPAAASPGTSRACCPRASASSSSPTRGSGRRSSAGSPSTACAEDELRRVFNIGIGYCAVVRAGDVREGDLVIGRCVAGVDGVTWSDA